MPKNKNVDQGVMICGIQPKTFKVDWFRMTPSDLGNSRSYLSEAMMKHTYMVELEEIPLWQWPEFKDRIIADLEIKAERMRKAAEEAAGPEQK